MNQKYETEQSAPGSGLEPSQAPKGPKAYGTRTLIFIAVLVAQGMVLSFIETLLPVPFIAPGAKLGLANIVTLTAVCMLTPIQAMTVVLLRVILGAVTFGSLSTFLFSVSGGMLSLGVMLFLYKFSGSRMSLVGISIAGAVAHNLGQLMVAAAMNLNALILTYLPILLIVAIPTGIFVGVVSRALIRYLKMFSAFK